MSDLQEILIFAWVIYVPLGITVILGLLVYAIWFL
jgi:hypothetical protein